MTIKELILKKFQEALEAQVKFGQKEIREQGHVATGDGLRSLEAKITSENIQKLVGAIMANDYMVEKVDPGVPRNQVPALRDHIPALLKWIDQIRPGMALSEKVSFARATARRHKSEGIPTFASKRFSTNGRRTGWIVNAFTAPEATSEFEDMIDIIRILTQDFERDLAA